MGKEIEICSLSDETYEKPCVTHKFKRHKYNNGESFWYCRACLFLTNEEPKEKFEDCNCFKKIGINMTRKIEIKPNDQSWCGKKVLRYNAKFHIEILYVGKNCFFGRTNSGTEASWDLGKYELYEEPEVRRYCIHNKPLTELCDFCNEEFKIHQGHHCSGKCTKLEEGITVQVDPKNFTVTNVSGETVIEPPSSTTIITECEHEWDKQNLLLTDPPQIRCKKCYSLKFLTSIKTNKKIKLVSPAIIFTTNTNGWFLTDHLFSSLEQAKNWYDVDETITWPARDQFGKELWFEVEE